MCFIFSQFGQFDYSNTGGAPAEPSQYYTPQAPAAAPYTGSIMTPDPVTPYSSPTGEEDYDNEPPLLEGICSFLYYILVMVILTSF